VLLVRTWAFLWLLKSVSELVYSLALAMWVSVLVLMSRVEVKVHLHNHWRL